jgi:hypothetical protein
LTDGVGCCVLCFLVSVNTEVTGATWRSYAGQIVVVRASHLDFGIGYLLVLGFIGVDVLATLGVEPHVHGAVVDDLDFIEVEVPMSQ